MPGNVPFHAVVERHDVPVLCGALSRWRSGYGKLRPDAQSLGPLDRLLWNYFAHQVATYQPRALLGLGHQTGIHQIGRRKHTFERAVLPDATDQCPGIDAGDAHHAESGEVVFQPAHSAKVTGHLALIADDEASQMRSGALNVFVVDAVVADLWIGHRDDLAAITRIGEDLLIPGHRSVEAHFAVDFARCTERLTGEDRSIFESELGNFHGSGRSCVFLRDDSCEVNSPDCNVGLRRWCSAC